MPAAPGPAAWMSPPCLCSSPPQYPHSVRRRDTATDSHYHSSDGSLLPRVLRAFPFLFGVNVMFCRCQCAVMKGVSILHIFLPGCEKGSVSPPFLGTMQMPYLHSCAKVVPAFLLSVLSEACAFFPHTFLFSTQFSDYRQRCDFVTSCFIFSPLHICIGESEHSPVAVPLEIHTVTNSQHSSGQIHPNAPHWRSSLILFITGS